MKEAIAVIAALLAVAGNVPYLRDIFKGRVQPHPYTWLVGALVSGIIFFGQIAKGAGIGALPTAASAAFTVTIFLLSLKYGFKGITKTDKAFMALALVAIVPWILTSDPTLSVILAVGIDLVAFVPTFRKTWHHPATETPILYGANVLRHVLALFSLEAYNIATTLHSIAMIAANSLMTLFILIHKGKRKGSKHILLMRRR